MPIRELPSKLELLHSNRRMTLESIKKYRHSIKKQRKEIAHEINTQKRIDMLEYMKEYEEILRFHEQCLKETDEAINEEESNFMGKDKQSVTKNNTILGEAIATAILSTTKQYDSVDAFMLGNELDYLKHRTQAQQAIPKLPEETTAQWMQRQIKNKTIYGEIEEMFKGKPDLQIFRPADDHEPATMIDVEFKDQAGDQSLESLNEYYVRQDQEWMNMEDVGAEIVEDDKFKLLDELEETIKMGMKMDTAEMKHYHLEHAAEILKRIQN